MSLEHGRPTDRPARGRRLIRWPELLERIPFSRQHLHRMISRGDFPAPIQIGPNAVAFDESAVEDWIDSRPRGPLPLPQGRAA